MRGEVPARQRNIQRAGDPIFRTERQCLVEVLGAHSVEALHLDNLFVLVVPGEGVPEDTLALAVGDLRVVKKLIPRPIVQSMTA